MIPEMTVEDLKARLDSKADFILLDVREPHELAIASIRGARPAHIPLGELPRRASELDKAREIAVLCRSGGRSARAVELLVQKGFRAVNVAGGILAWAARVDPSVPTY